MRWGKTVAYTAYAALVVLASSGLACESSSGTSTAPRTGTGGVGPPGPTGVEATPTPTLVPLPSPSLVQLPSVTSIAPHSGTDGSQVTISGTGFASAVAVCFGGVASPDYRVSDSGTRITAVVPPGSGRVPVAVITAVTASAVGPGDTFTYRGSALAGGGTGSALPASPCALVPPEASS